MAAKFANLPSGKVFLQVLGCGIEDATPCLFLFTDSKRYMFNCGEGTQRLFTENKVKLGKLNTIFFTHNKWSHLGGFLGMSMTLRDIGKEKIGIHGPSGLKKVIHGARSFLNKENVNFSVTEYSVKTAKPYSDDELTIHPIVIDPEEKNTNSSGNLKTSSSGDKSNRELVEEYHLKHHEQCSVVCYAAKLRNYPGKLLPKVAISLGVPKGPMFRLLKDGQTVTLPNGKEIKPADVMEPSIPGPSFIIVDCPARKYIPGIARHKAFKKYQKDGTEQATLVIHMTKKHLIKDQTYQNWIKRFHEETYHCIVDSSEISKCSTVFRSQFTVQCKLNLLHPTIFPAIELWRNEYDVDNIAKDNNNETSRRLCFWKNMTKFTLRPSNQIGQDESEILKAVDLQTVTDETLEMLRTFDNTDGQLSKDRLKKNTNELLTEIDEQFCTETKDTVEHRIEDADANIRTSTVNTSNCNVSNDAASDSIKMKRKRLHEIESSHTDDTEMLVSKMCKCDNHENKDLKEIDESSTICDCSKKQNKNVLRYPRVVFLGTGSSIPSKYRNVSSILIHTSPESTALLDCGEGTLGQIVNHYGQEAESIIKRLNFIFISHMHADHHLGVIRLLKMHKQILRKDSQTNIPPLIAGPEKFCIWLHEYAATFESLSFRFADCRRLVGENFQTALADYLPGMTKVIFVPVDHHTEAYGISLCHQDGWKLTYSGDTEPCQSLVDAGKNSTLLIHEATFEDGMEDEAKEKHHSTCGQALEIAAKMNARNVLLTHFSQRYSKLPIMKDQTPVAIAFDHMEVHPDDIPEICNLLPKLQVLFPDEGKTN